MYRDRQDAAHQLVPLLQDYKNQDDVIILAVPRGALEIGVILAQELQAPLDVIFVKKIGAPGNPELAIGAVSMNHMKIASEYQQYTDYIDEQVKEIRKTIKERTLKYRGDAPTLDLKDKVVIITDDGVATGKTLIAAIDMVKKHNPKKIIVAIPVGPYDTIEKIKKMVDKVICLETPVSFMAVGQFYKRFPQVEDETAIELLKKANE